MSWFEHGASRIYFEDSGAGNPLLLLPGWAGSIEELAPLRVHFASKFRVIAADLPGSGKSEPQPRAYTPTYYHDDAAAFLALLDHLGAGPAHIVGFSDGGEVAFVMAEERPTAVRSIATWGAAGTIEAPPEMLDAFDTLIDEPIEPLADLSAYLKSAYGEENARAMSSSFAAALRGIIANGGDVSRARAGDIACPALLITGEHDFVATPALVSEIAGAIPGATYIEVKDAEHDVHHAQPEWLATTILAFLAKQS